MSRSRKRRPYRRSRAFDRSCRNHGSCPWCRGNRTFQARRAHLRLSYGLDDLRFHQDPFVLEAFVPDPCPPPTR